VCPTCNRLADPTWPLCAYCGTDFGRDPKAARLRGRVPAPVAATGIAGIESDEDPASAADATAEHGRLRGATHT
jgi:hypothetical protein